MIACPACGTMHPATDLVCGACGKLLADNLPGDSSWAHLRETAGRNMALAKAHLVPRLARNFRMLGRDIAVVFRLCRAPQRRTGSRRLIPATGAQRGVGRRFACTPSEKSEGIFTSGLDNRRAAVYDSRDKKNGCWGLPAETA